MLVSIKLNQFVIALQNDRRQIGQHAYSVIVFCNLSFFRLNHLVCGSPNLGLMQLGEDVFALKRS